MRQGDQRLSCTQNTEPDQQLHVSSEPNDLVFSIHYRKTSLSIQQQQHCTVLLHTLRLIATRNKSASLEFQYCKQIESQ